MKSLIAFLCMHAVLCMAAAPPRILSTRILTVQPLEYQKTEFSIDVSASFTNPFVQGDIAVDMHLTAPSGREFSLPCFSAPAIRSPLIGWRDSHRRRQADICIISRRRITLTHRSPPTRWSSRRLHPPGAVFCTPMATGA